MPSQQVQLDRAHHLARPTARCIVRTAWHIRCKSPSQPLTSLEGAMKRLIPILPLPLLLLLLGACSSSTDPSSTSSSTSSKAVARTLRDTKHDGVLKQVSPDPGSNGGLILAGDADGMCPVMVVTTTTTTVTDSEGNVLSTTTTTCTQCYAADGMSPIGAPTCDDGSSITEIDIHCLTYSGEDPMMDCWRCVDSTTGAVTSDSCRPLPSSCMVDSDCPAGEVCYTDGGTMPPPPPPPPSPDGGPMMPPPPPPHIGANVCGPPDPCVPVMTLPSDPTGVSCWVCTDPSGVDLGSWCDEHLCAADGTCAHPWETCDPAGSGKCIPSEPPYGCMTDADCAAVMGTRCVDNLCK
jgi:hypothetical protein